MTTEEIWPIKAHALGCLYIEKSSCSEQMWEGGIMRYLSQKQILKIHLGLFDAIRNLT